MNHNCPNCDINLKWKFLRNIAGARRLEIDGEKYVSIGKCPNCKVVIGMNVHPSEKSIQKSMLPVVVIALVMSINNIWLKYEFGSTVAYTIFVALLVLFMAFSIAYGKKSSKIPMSWHRYVCSPNKQRNADYVADAPPPVR